MSAQPLPEAVDVLVVGARAAGAAAALLLARRGVRVLAIERAPAGADTLSTHALMRGGVVQLQRWGLLPAIVDAGTPPITRTVFDYGGETVDVAINERHGVSRLHAPRRPVLDGTIAAAASAAGADVRYGHRLLSLDRDAAGRVCGAAIETPDGRGRQVRAGIVVGADGRHSTVARLAGAERLRIGQAQTGTVYGHWPNVTGDGYRWGFAQDACVGMIPTNGGACVFVTLPASRFVATFRPDLAAGFHQVVSRLDPSLGAATQAMPPRAGLHGFAGMAGSFTRSAGPGWALVGDAGYFKDPLTAHGITDALLHAELLADAITAGTDAALAAYDAQRTTLATPVFEATEAIAGFGWTLATLPALHKQLSRAMAAEIDEALGLFREPGGIGPGRSDQVLARVG